MCPQGEEKRREGRKERREEGREGMGWWYGRVTGKCMMCVAQYRRGMEEGGW